MLTHLFLMAYYDIYRDQLASLHHGHALWEPDPSGLYDQVQVGDVGYVREGHFLRLFNTLLSADDRAQVHGVPEGFVPLNIGPANIRTLNLFKGDYCSSTVTVAVDHAASFQAAYVTSYYPTEHCSFVLIQWVIAIQMKAQILHTNAEENTKEPLYIFPLMA